MAPLFKKYWQIISAVIGALAILGTALWTKHTGGDDYTWLYVFCLWLILNSAFEVYFKLKKNKDQ